MDGRLQPLFGVLEKALRAEKHLETLDVEWQKFIGSEPCPYRFPVEVDPDTGDNLIKAEVVQQPPYLLSVIVGDVLHNLRSALDHLAWELVKRAGGKPGRHTNFPICDTDGQWRAEVERRRRTGDRPSPLAGIEPGSPIWTFFEERQPCNGGDHAKALTELRVLSNADKHRSLLISGVYPDPDEFAAVLDWNPDAVLRNFELLIRPDQPLKDGTPVAALNFDPTKPDPHVQVQGELAFDVAFSDGRWDSDRPTLIDLKACLGQYVEDAAGFYTGAPY